MGRFDILKENTFTSSSNNKDSNMNKDNSNNTDSNKNRNNSRNKDNNRKIDSTIHSNRDRDSRSAINSSRDRDNRIRDRYIDNNRSISTNNLFKQKEKEKKEYFIEEHEELFPDLVIQDETVKENNNNNIESQWLEIAEKEAENDIKCNHISIDNDPKYWKGSQWIGNMLIRSKKTNETCDNNLNKDKESDLEENHYIEYNQRITYSRVKYSRDGNKWYNNWDATFSKKQLDSMNDENNNKMINRWSKWIENDYEKRRLKSEEYYNDTREVDNFMIAEQEMLEYEEYEKQLDCENECLEDDESSEDEIV